MKDISKMINQAEFIWIYGAGKIGRRMVGLLDNLGKKVKGVIVTDKSTNPSNVFGIKVYGLDEVCIEHNECIMVAINGMPQKEILEKLKEGGYENIFAWNEYHTNEVWLAQKYRFIDRRQGKKRACFVLAGYKGFLWEIVFERLKKFLPDEMDVCICSSGIFVEKLAEIAEENRWSYLSTEINSVTLVQNIAFSLFDDVEWIYKMDEDVFLTEGIFEKMYDTFLLAENANNGYRVGFAAPLIPVNGFGYRTILEMYGCLEEYEKSFGNVILGGNTALPIEKDPNAAMFMWGNEKIPHLDEIAKGVCNRGYVLCGVRFSIGFILFKKSLWERMEGFSVIGNKDLGIDEEELCGWCMNESEAIVVVENAVAGHFSFGSQTDAMKEYMVGHSERFDIRSV